VTDYKVTITFDAGIDNLVDGRITLNRLKNILETALSLTGNEISWCGKVEGHIELMEESE